MPTAAPAHALGARNGSQRVQPPSDVARSNQILLAGQGLPVRLSPTVTDILDFPDTEEVTGSNPVRPTIFEKLSRGGSPKESPTGSQQQRNWRLLPPRWPSARVMTVVATGAVQRRQLLQYDEPLLTFDSLRTLFPQVNMGRHDMSPGSRGLSRCYRTALHDRLKALPDGCPTKARFRSREAVLNASHTPGQRQSSTPMKDQGQGRSPPVVSWQSLMILGAERLTAAANV